VAAIAVVAALAGGIIGWSLRGPAFPVVNALPAPASPSPIPASPVNKAKAAIARRSFCADATVLPSIVNDLRHHRSMRFRQRIGALANRLQADTMLAEKAGDARFSNRWGVAVTFLTGKDTGSDFFQLVNSIEVQCRLGTHAA
jgi:hypothetical protein